MPLETGGHGFVELGMLVLLAYPSTLASAGWKGRRYRVNEIAKVSIRWLCQYRTTDLPAPGFEPRFLMSGVRHSNHSATAPDNTVLLKVFNIKLIHTKVTRNTNLQLFKKQELGQD